MTGWARLLVGAGSLLTISLIVASLGPMFYRLGRADLERRRERRKRRNRR